MPVSLFWNFAAHYKTFFTHIWVPTLGLGYTLILSLYLFISPKGYLSFWLTYYNSVRIFYLCMRARCPAELIVMNVVIVVTSRADAVNKFVLLMFGMQQVILRSSKNERNHFVNWRVMSVSRIRCFVSLNS